MTLGKTNKLPALGGPALKGLSPIKIGNSVKKLQDFMKQNTGKKKYLPTAAPAQSGITWGASTHVDNASESQTGRRIMNLSNGKIATIAAVAAGIPVTDADSEKRAFIAALGGMLGRQAATQVGKEVGKGAVKEVGKGVGSRLLSKGLNIANKGGDAISFGTGVSDANRMLSPSNAARQ